MKTQDALAERLRRCKEEADKANAALANAQQEYEAMVNSAHAKRMQAFATLLTPELINVLLPAHERTSCSDEDPNNHYRARCARCALLEAQQSGFWDLDIDMTLNLKYKAKF